MFAAKNVYYNLNRIQHSIFKTMASIKFPFRQESSIYSRIISQIDRICKDNYVDETHGLSHAMKIAQLAFEAIQSQDLEQELKQDIICSAFLHDIDDRKYFNSKNFENAVTVLTKINFDQERIKKIIKMIDLVSFAKNGNTIDNQIPYYFYLTRYIDRTQAIGVQGLHRSLVFNQQRIKKVPIYLESTPRPRSQPQLQLFSQGRDIQYMKTGSSSSVVDHVFDKLLHIRLPEQIKNNFMINLYDQKRRQMQQFVLKHAMTNYQFYEKDLQKEYEKNKHIWYNQK